MVSGVSFYMINKNKSIKMSSNDDTKTENKLLMKPVVSDKMTRKVSFINGNYPENTLTTEISITKSDISCKPNYVQLAKSNNASMHKNKSTHQQLSQFRTRCLNRVTFIDQLYQVPLVSVSLIESFKRYNSHNNYDSFGPSDDSQKSNCCSIT